MHLQNTWSPAHLCSVSFFSCLLLNSSDEIKRDGGKKADGAFLCRLFTVEQMLHRHDSTSSVPLVTSLLPFEAITAGSGARTWENSVERRGKYRKSGLVIRISESLYSLFSQMSAMMIPFYFVFVFFFWVCWPHKNTLHETSIQKHTHTCKYTHSLNSNSALFLTVVTSLDWNGCNVH